VNESSIQQGVGPKDLNIGRRNCPLLFLLFSSSFLSFLHFHCCEASVCPPSGPNYILSRFLATKSRDSTILRNLKKIHHLGFYYSSPRYAFLCDFFFNFWYYHSLTTMNHNIMASLSCFIVDPCFLLILHAYFLFFFIFIVNFIFGFMLFKKKKHYGNFENSWNILKIACNC